MRFRIAVVAALGLALAVYLVTYVGLYAVLAAATAVGWRGFAILCAAALLIFLILGTAWYVLIPGPSPVPLRVFIWARMVRDSGAEVLPFSQVGGMALGARAAVLHGLASPLAVASLIVDVTTEMLAQIVYVALGILILSASASETPLVRSLTTIFAIGLLIAAAGGAIFMALQRYGHHWVARQIAGRLFPSSMPVTSAAAAALDAIYRSRAHFGLSLLLHFCAWITSAVWTWLAFRLIGQRVELAAVVAIESLIYATRSAAFLVPNALGVQEAAYAVLAPVLGVGQEYALAVSLLKRARDIAIGTPVLLIWQGEESRRALKRSS